MTPPTKSLILGPPARRSTDPVLLRGAPTAPALVTATGTTTYAELGRLVAAERAVLGATRRLVVLEAGNDVRSVATYLASVEGGHPVLLLAPGDLDRHRDLVERYDPDVVAPVAAGAQPRREGSAHDLHPDLALLLSTSGSTGSPKLVRLSRGNLTANADSIAAYLGLGPGDRAMTSLPLHYCYGLSVLTSHLRAGASVVLTEHSVVDECFWDLARSSGATSFAGVPYTFELLDRSGFARRDLPDLRQVTQAGGRLPPEQVVRYAGLGRERGWELVVMYGQTEATARMAYLPPHLAATHPTSIGTPVPGGALHLEPVDGCEPGVGELVYSGPNVMMGYATAPADLARGHELASLRTGDLGRRTASGLWEVVGRRDRIAKVFGLRLDLDRLESALADDEPGAVVVATDARLHVLCPHLRSRDAVLRRACDLTGLPASAVRVSRAERPRLPSGKTDYAALGAHAALLEEGTPTPPTPVTPSSVRDVFAEVLGRPDAGLDDSFVSLRGDSLSFVESSHRLASHLGALPREWPRLTARELAARARRRRHRLVPTEIPAVLRAVSIVMILLTHTDRLLVPGGAHVLLVVAGFNLSRFLVDASTGPERVRRIIGSLAAVVVPAGLWIAAVGAVTGDYRWTTALLLNQVMGGERWSDDWEFWFLEALAVGFLLTAALLAVPVLARLRDRRPFGFAMGVLAVTLALRYLLVGVEAGPTERYTSVVVLWCIALGWAASCARNPAQRALVVVTAVVAVHGFFGDPQREAVVATGVALLVLVVHVPLPRPVTMVVRVVAGASLWIYLTHWQVYRPLEDAGHPWWALVASLAVGVAAASLVTRLRLRLPAGTGPPARRPRLRH